MSADGSAQLARLCSPPPDPRDQPYCAHCNGVSDLTAPLAERTLHDVVLGGNQATASRCNKPPCHSPIRSAALGYQTHPDEGMSSLYIHTTYTFCLNRYTYLPLQAQIILHIIPSFIYYITPYLPWTHLETPGQANQTSSPLPTNLLLPYSMKPLTPKSKPSPHASKALLRRGEDELPSWVWEWSVLHLSRSSSTTMP